MAPTQVMQHGSGHVHFGSTPQIKNPNEIFIPFSNISYNLKSKSIVVKPRNFVPMKLNDFTVFDIML